MALAFLTLGHSRPLPPTPDSTDPTLRRVLSFLDWRLQLQTAIAGSSSATQTLPCRPSWCSRGEHQLAPLVTESAAGCFQPVPKHRMKLFSPGSGVLLLILAAGAYLKSTKSDRSTSPPWQQSQRAQVSASAAKPSYTEDQKRAALMLLAALAAAAQREHAEAGPSSTPMRHSGYQTGASHSQYPALRGDSPSPKPQRLGEATGAGAQMPSSYVPSTSMPGGNTETQRFVNEFTRLYPGTSPGDALGLYEAIRQIR